MHGFGLGGEWWAGGMARPQQGWDLPKNHACAAEQAATKIINALACSAFSRDGTCLKIMHVLLNRLPHRSSPHWHAWAVSF